VAVIPLLRKGPTRFPGWHYSMGNGTSNCHPTMAPLPTIWGLPVIPTIWGTPFPLRPLPIYGQRMGASFVPAITSNPQAGPSITVQRLARRALIVLYSATGRQRSAGELKILRGPASQGRDGDLGGRIWRPAHQANGQPRWSCLSELSRVPGTNMMSFMMSSLTDTTPGPLQGCQFQGCRTRFRMPIGFGICQDSERVPHEPPSLAPGGGLEQGWGRTPPAGPKMPPHKRSPQGSPHPPIIPRGRGRRPRISLQCGPHPPNRPPKSSPPWWLTPRSRHPWGA
jgi:hypothetical protein